MIQGSKARQSARRVLLRYMNTSASARQSIATIRLPDSSIAGLPSQPKLSISMPMPNCPTITATVATAVPTMGTAPTITIMYTTPNSAPVSCHLGTSSKLTAWAGSKKKINSAVVIAPTAKVSKLLRNTPTAWPRRPLMAACTLSTAPAAITSTNNRIRFIALPSCNQNKCCHNQRQRNPALTVDPLARRAKPAEMVDQYTLAHLAREDRDHGHGDTDMRRGQRQHHHIHRPQEAADQLPAWQVGQRRAFLRAAEQQQQKQDRRAHAEDAQGRPQVAYLYAQRPEQPCLHRQAHARQNHQRQQQQP